MTFTRANIEGTLVARAGLLMKAAGMDGTTVSGSNASLNDPIGWAMRQADYTVANISLITDTDVALVSDAMLDMLLDFAEYRLLMSIGGNLPLVDISSGQQRQALSQIATRAKEQLADVRERIETLWGFGFGTLTAGVVGLNFAEHTEDE